jgi:hypothetical protein
MKKLYLASVNLDKLIDILPEPANKLSLAGIVVLLLGYFAN